MKKNLCCNENQWNSVVMLKKLINIFIGDVYSMYYSSARNWVSFMYKGLVWVYIIYVMLFGE